MPPGRLTVRSLSSPSAQSSKLAMSNSDAAAEIVAEYDFILQANCCTVAALTALFYEYIVTFDREVQLVWGRKITSATVLFILNRYVTFLQYIAVIPGFFPISDKVCLAVGYYTAIAGLLPYFVWAAFFSLRVYGLSGRKWGIASLVLTLSAASMAVNLYNIAFARPINQPSPFNCGVADILSDAVHDKLVISSRTCLIASDALVLAVTWSKTYQLRKAAQQAQVKASLLTLLLRDGTIYFVVLLILNALHIVFNFVEQVPFVSIFADAFTSILISRFILNLREVDIHVHGGMRSGRATFDGSMSYQSQPDTIIFTSNNNFVDSIGASLDHGFPSVDEDGAAAISTARDEPENSD